MNPKSPLEVLVVEDDALVASVLTDLLKGHRTQFFSTAQDCLKASGNPQLILLDLCHAADPNGEKSVALIPEIRARFSNADVVVQSGVENITLMRQCVAGGASRFVAKTALDEELPLILAQQAEVVRVRAEIVKSLIGDSAVMQLLREKILNYRLRSRADVLVVGESGSGKELCARALHAEGPWVAVNVAAVPAELFEAEFFGSDKGAFTGATQARAGFFEAAENGTLFLDEVQSLDLALQAKLLRVLESRTFRRVGSSQERYFAGRVVCAANQDLIELVGQGQFREDLYYRIAALKMEVPPLRARGSDIVALFKRFLADEVTGSAPKLAPEAEDFLRSAYDWPGNVRELKSLCRALAAESRIPILGQNELQAQLLRHEPKPTASNSSAEFRLDISASFDSNVAALEKYLLTDRLSKQSATQARESLGLTRTRFYEKLKRYGLS